MNLDRSQIKVLVQEVLIEILLSSSSLPTQTSEQWISLKKAWILMGYPSYQALHRDVKRGLFRKDKELRDRRKPGAKIARWQIDIVAAGKRLKEDPSKRRSV
jgi:hypothetical protein